MNPNGAGDRDCALPNLQEPLDDVEITSFTYYPCEYNDINNEI